METNPTFRRAGFLALGALALLLVVSKPADAQILSTQISTAPQLTSSQYVNIPGLFLTLPPKSATQTYALIILNVPAPYASGSNFPGVTFAINVMGSLVAEGGFTYSQKTERSAERGTV